MPLKNIYLVQPNICYEDTMYLPYAAGALAAYAWQDEQIAGQYRLKKIICEREDIAAAVSALEQPFLTAFSNYIWNFEYNKAFAKEVKRQHPSCLTVFGGHNVPPGADLLREHSFIDILVDGEGEAAFRDILLHLIAGKDFSNIPNIAFREADGKPVVTRSVPMEATDFPSPYRAGLFDDILARYPQVRFSAILETNRGCPYSCAFCDWCSLAVKVRALTRQRVLDDLAWMSEHQIEFCYCADANYGILPADEQYVDRLIELHEASGYPKKFRVNYAKHNNSAVFRINSKLNACGLSKGATISFQSLNPEVLANIGRKNMTIEKFSELMGLYAKAGIPAYSELILGLPGETYKSFCDGVGKLLEAGQHTSLLIYNCELILNSRMADEAYRKKFGIQTAITPLYLRHDEPQSDPVQELSRSVVATSSMDTGEWVKANLFSVAVQSCHGMGLLRCFSLYLHTEQGVPYAGFYQAIVDWALEHPAGVLGSEMLSLRSAFGQITQGTGAWSCVKTEFGNVSWPYEEALYLALVYRLDDFYEEVRGFLARYDIPPELFGSLLLYQQSIVKIPGKRSFKIRLDCDWASYFGQILTRSRPELRKQHVEVSARDDTLPERWDDFAKQCVWYGRKEQENLFTQLTVKPCPGE